MRKSCIPKLINTTVILVGLLMLFPPVLGAEGSGQKETKMKGKIFGDQLMVFEAGRKYGIRIGLYYSTIDWSWSKKPRFGHTHKIPDDPVILAKYNKYYLAQLHELMEIFPDNLLLWFDGYQFKPSFPALIEQDKVYHDLKNSYPNLIVASNTGVSNRGKTTGLTDILLLENGAGQAEVNWNHGRP